jgi:hypothetical protein
MSLHKPTWSGCKYYYVPELNGNEAGIISVGHHSIHDGVTIMQSFQKISDAGGEYPFIKKAELSLLQWFLIYFTTPISWP